MKGNFVAWADDFLSLIYPRLCMACGNSLFLNEDVLCNRCLVHLPQTRFHLNPKDNLVVRSFWGRVPIEGGAARYFFRKSAPVQQLLHNLKYNHAPEIGVYLGRIYGRELLESEVFRSVRETYIGNIEALPPEIFPETFDYIALGHFHIPMAIRHNIRYSGSPIPLGFDELSHPKCVFIIESQNHSEKMQITKVEIPVFQTLASVKGNKHEIETRLEELKKKSESVWVEIIYTGEEIFTNLTEWVNQITDKSNIEVINIKNLKSISRLLTRQETDKTLEDLNETEIFRKLLETSKIPENQREELTALYNEILESIRTLETL